MESIENGSYENQFDARSPNKKYYSSNEIFSILDDLVKILRFAAYTNIYHSDLKPANLLIKSDGRPKIADFGESFRMSAGAGRSKLKGTPAFLSYNIRSAWNVAQTSGQAPDFDHDPEKSDVMSLAITIIDMCLLRIVNGLNDEDSYIEI